MVAGPAGGPGSVRRWWSPMWSTTVFSRIQPRGEHTERHPPRWNFATPSRRKGKEVPRRRWCRCRRCPLKPGETGRSKVVGTGKGLRPYTAFPAGIDQVVHQRSERRRLWWTRRRSGSGIRSVTVKGGGLVLNGRPLTFLGTGPNICPLLDREMGRRSRDCSGDDAGQHGRSRKFPLSAHLQFVAGGRMGVTQQRTLPGSGPRTGGGDDLGVLRRAPVCVGWISATSVIITRVTRWVAKTEQDGERFFSIAEEVASASGPDSGS